MVLYLHIGTEKTGSTSIQRFFAANRERLAANGILYPSAPGRANHLALAGLAHKKPGGEIWRKLKIESEDDYKSFRAELRSNLAAELASHAGEKTILSNEHCSSRLKSTAEIEDLRLFLSEFFDDIRVVVYLRRQDDFFVSTYSTAIKTGHTEPLALPQPHKLANRYDYWDLLSRWAAVFGRERLICRKFERESLAGGDVVRDALAAMGIAEREDYERMPDANKSLDAASLEFLRLMNTHCGPDRRARKIIATLERLSDGPLIDLTEEGRRELMENVRNSNACVAREYFGGELEHSDDPLFRPRSDLRPRVSNQVLSTDKAVAIATALLAEQALARQHARAEGRRRPRRRGQKVRALAAE